MQNIDELQQSKLRISELERQNSTLNSELQNIRSPDSRFETIFTDSNLGKKIIDSNLEIVQVNRALCDIMGYSEQEFIGQKIIDFCLPDYLSGWIVLQNKLWGGETNSFTLETQLIKKDKSVSWFKVTSTLFKEQGKTFGYTILEDINVMKTLEQERIELEARKDEFISVACHELKTPLTNIISNIQLLERQIKKEENINPDTLKMVVTANNNAKKLASLVSDLLDMTKIEQGDLLLKKSNFLISELIEGCCETYKYEGQVLTVTGDLGIEVNADYLKIEQVLTNLLNNAFKYAPQSKEVIIHSERLPEHVKISVQDFGEGIPKEKLPDLFDIYYRADKEKRQISGLGLGLYICSRIVSHQGGTIGVESEVGQGSTFWFTIPLN